MDLSQNHFTNVGIEYFIGKTVAKPDDIIIESLDLSNCSLGDSSLETASASLDIVKVLNLSDNSFTRYSDH